MIILTEKQFMNLNLLHAEIKKKYPNFVGFNGSRDKMQVLGIKDEEATAEINNIDLDLLIPKPKTEEEKFLDMLDNPAVRAKIKNISLSKP